MKSLRNSCAFDVRVDGWVAAALKEGVDDFHDLLYRLPGVFPADAANAIQRLTRTAQITSSLGLRFERQPQQVRSEPGLAMLPPPHPLDFEWRFSAATSNELLRLAKSHTTQGDEILLFGTPTLAMAAIREPRDRAISFVGEDNIVAQSVSARNEATAAPISVRTYAPGVLVPCSADAVVLDPPWYFDFIRPMLSAAAYVCRPLGIVVASLPPIGARATAENDRRSVRLLAERLSLEEITAAPCAVIYETPFFEANALAATGLHGIRSDWRRGDLVIFRKRPHPKTKIAQPGIRKQRWREVSVGRMRLFIRSGAANGAAAPTLRSLVPGDVLPSVSRRDPRRRRAQVWTSGNRIFATDRPDLVFAAAVEIGGAPHRSDVLPRDFGDHRDALERLKYALLDMANIEEHEERIGRQGG